MSWLWLIPALVTAAAILWYPFGTVSSRADEAADSLLEKLSEPGHF